MPRVDDTPKTLKPYVCHGVHLDWSAGAEEAIGDCPFCGKERKFSVNVKTGQYRCWVCGTGTSKGGGNSVTFVRELWKLANGSTSDYSELAKDRGLVHDDTLIRWDAAVSPLTGEWVLPGYGVDGKLNQLYRYHQSGSAKRLLLATSELPHALHGVNLYSADCKTVYVCEGPWDAKVLWEVLKSCKWEDGVGSRLVSSGEASSLASEACVIAPPGCNVWQDGWSKLLSGKDVVFLYDSDHPKTDAKGVTHPPAGLSGMVRACQRLAAASDKPRSISYLCWGEDGYAKDLKSGYDVRDYLTQSDTMEERFRRLEELLAMVRVIPPEWVGGRSIESQRSGDVTIQPQECTSWKSLRNAWGRAMRWTDDLDYGMSCVLAVCASTDTAPAVQQLWIKLISPPSSGKTTLVEGAAVARDFVYSKDTFTGLTSGFQADAAGEDNFSMIQNINGKTLVIKDGDTLKSRPNLTDILSQLRALYDRALRTQFKNKMSKDWEKINCTVVICGTAAIKELDKTEQLGERFLDVVIMERIDHGLEDDIQDRVVAKMFDEEEDDDSHEEHLLRAKRMTGGYVQHLRATCPAVWKTVKVPKEARDAIKSYALFVAHMRARPSVKQTETVEREMSPRLTEQFGRLVRSLAVVLNRKEVDEEVLRRARRVALDTARGDVLLIARCVYEHRGPEGCAQATIEADTKISPQKARELVRFLERIEVLESFQWADPKATGVRVVKHKRWRLTPRMLRIYEEVVHESR